jgi:hypothetical protein
VGFLSPGKVAVRRYRAGRETLNREWIISITHLAFTRAPPND